MTGSETEITEVIDDVEWSIAFAKVKEFETQEIDLITQILTYGIQNDEFDDRIEQQLDILPFIIISSLKGIEFDLFTENRFAGIENRISIIANLLLKGLKK